MPTAPFLHVANGASTTGTIQAAGIPGILSIWADPLYEGPVPGDVDDDALREIRGRYLGGDLRRWRRVIAAHDDYGELVLWYEHDLFDQLNLIQLLSWIRGRLPHEKPVSLISVGEFPGHADFKGLGELTPRELAPLFLTRQRVSDEQYSLADRAWQAFRAPTPVGLDTLRATNTSALPYLASAFTRFLEEYPWTSDGLSRTERRLLQLAADGPIDLLALFPRMHEGESAYYVTDLSLVGIAEELSRTSPPLATLTPGPREGRDALMRRVSATEAGRAVFDGRRDRVEMCGLERWFGGVRWNRNTCSWRWDPARRRMTPGA